MKIPFLFKICLFLSRVWASGQFWRWFGWLGGTTFLILGLAKENLGTAFCGGVMIALGFIFYQADKTFVRLDKLLEETRKKFYKQIEELEKGK